MQDADAIFMYKTIKSICPTITIITELAQISTINFLIQQKDDNENIEKHGFAISKPFLSGEIYFSSLLDTMICQSYYSPKIVEILEQMIMGNVNVPNRHMKLYQ